MTALERTGDDIGFVELDIGDEAGIDRMSALASAIVKEHFDPIIGSAQNDYMIDRFQSPAAVRSLLEQGYRYFFVVDAAGAEIGFITFVARADDMYLSKFYLEKASRGRGYANRMMAFVADAARDAGLDAITLNVNRGNDARFAYEAMGFRIIRTEVIDIGAGFVMDDYVYELKL